MLRMTASVMMIILMRVTADSSRCRALAPCSRKHSIGARGGVSTSVSQRVRAALDAVFIKTVRRKSGGGFVLMPVPFRMVSWIILYAVERVRRLGVRLKTATADTEAQRIGMKEA